MDLSNLKLKFYFKCGYFEKEFKYIFEYLKSIQILFSKYFLSTLQHYEWVTAVCRNGFVKF